MQTPPDGHPLNPTPVPSLDSLRQETWRGTPPPLNSLGKVPRARSRRSSLLALALCASAGLAYGGYQVVNRSWTASITVNLRDVEVIYNGHPVPPENVEWLADGRCIVSVNGARIILDPTQEGGAAASITVTEGASLD